MKIFSNENYKLYLGYFLLVVVTCVLAFQFIKNANIAEFISSMENKTFDLRQQLISQSGARKSSDKIAIIAIDDASYEYLLDKYGEWPIPRSVYADVIEYVSAQNPAALAFDLMFVKSVKSSGNDDELLTKAIKKYKNVYVSMNFDDQEIDVRKPIDLSEKFRINVKNDSKIDFHNISGINFSNCRGILPQILQSTDNVGLINVSRSDDGILREAPPMLLYKGDFYPHLSQLVGSKYLNQKNPRDFVVDKNGELRFSDRAIKLDKDGGAILNWYSKNANGDDFEVIPFYKLVKAIESGDKLEYDLKDKFLYVGATAVSLFDNKSVPVAKVYPGVNLHATYLNNLLDNDFIKKTDGWVNVLVGLLLAFIVGCIVIKTKSTVVALVSTILTIFAYVVLSYFIMLKLHIWIAIVLPVLFVILTLVFGYIIKYILKSRDFEYQYKLATTDGLTELYNHRYFQEQMLLQIANAKRYNTHFSLILIDIDFFKKFNDKFGHQSGDAVLRQVAKLLKKNVRATDFVCRYGGEEMTIILPNSDKEEAVITAQKLCNVISSTPCKLANGQESTVTISLGVSTFPEDGETPAALIAVSDEKLYKAKENGRNQVGK